MKHTFELAVVVIAASLLSSCTNNGNSISEINLIPVKSGREYQYIDKEGKIVINPQFQNASVFREGLALVETSGSESLIGFITEDGKYAINPQYQEATVFSEGLAWVVAENAAPTAIDHKGEIKFILQDAEEVRLFKDGLSAFSMVNEEGEEKWGFVDLTGKIVINPQFSSVSNFSEGLCGVKNSDNKWGFINKEGQIVINHQFDGTGNFQNEKCIVQSGNKEGVVDKEGRYVINPQYNSMIVDGDIFLVNQGGKYGWCDKEGKLLINPQFNEAYPFNGNSITAVQSGKNYGYIDKDGKITINPQFDQALPFNGKLAPVVSSGKVGFIDKDGRYVINPQFDDVARDLAHYYLTGDSEFKTVKTDYFNVDAIASIISFDNPEGFTFNSNFEDAMQKYDMTENYFSEYEDEYEVVSVKKITNDANYTFYIHGNAYDRITVNKDDGWYTYTDIEYEFNPKNRLTSYTYIIQMIGKGYGKQDAVISAIQSKLNGYKKDDNKSNASTEFYSNEDKNVGIIKENGYIVIQIEEVATEEYEEHEEYEEYID